jgi:signal transduction histidine kinase
VSDNGRGFEPPEDLGALTPTGKLGLAGMQERVQLLGGTVRLESEPGKGTTVSVEAPV